MSTMIDTNVLMEDVEIFNEVFEMKAKKDGVWNDDLKHTLETFTGMMKIFLAMRNQMEWF